MPDMRPGSRYLGFRGSLARTVAGKSMRVTGPLVKIRPLIKHPHPTFSPISLSVSGLALCAEYICLPGWSNIYMAFTSSTEKCKSPDRATYCQMDGCRLFGGIQSR